LIDLINGVTPELSKHNTKYVIEKTMNKIQHTSRRDMQPVIWSVWPKKGSI